MGNQQERDTPVQWKVIPFAEKYMVSERGDIYSTLRNKILKTTMVRKYHRVSFITNEGKDKAYLVHRVVALCFIENPDNKPEVNHIDGNPDNNRVSNLEWVTRQENQKHAFDNELNTNSGEANGRCVMPSETAIEIYKALLNGMSCNEASQVFGYNKATIRNIKIKKNWNQYLRDLPDIPIKKNKNKPLTKDQVTLIKSLRATQGKTCKQISEMLGFGLGQVEGVFRTRGTTGV